MVSRVGEAWWRVEWDGGRGIGEEEGHGEWGREIGQGKENWSCLEMIYERERERKGKEKKKREESSRARKYMHLKQTA